MSTATDILGPWTPPAPQPVLETTPGAWDSDSVASMNIMRNPEPGHPASEAWLAWYEGGTGPGSAGVWTLGLATAPSATGPWTKYAKNPIMTGNVTCDPSRQFHGDPKNPRQFCNGLYVGSVLNDKAVTGGEYYLYLEAPINMNDEGPLALWTSKHAEGPFAFKSYVLDGAHGLAPSSGKAKWDAGRYSESRVWHHNGLFHVMASGSPIGTSLGPNPDKIHEQLGWAVSADGVHFSEVPWNPVVSFNESQPHTIALAEGHVWFDDARQLVVVFHTVRWDRPNAPPPVAPPYTKDPFAPDGRNAEDLGFSVLSPSPTFAFDLPLITPTWKLDLAEASESPCSYDWKNQRYCAPIKVLITGAAPADKPLAPLAPSISFTVKAASGGGCGGGDSGDRGGRAAAAGQAGGVSVRVYGFDDHGVDRSKVLEELEARGSCDSSAGFSGTTATVQLGKKYRGVKWVVGNVAVASGSAGLRGVTLAAHYESSPASVV